MQPKQSKKTSARRKKEKPESEDLDFTNPDFSFFPKGRHIYRQQGPYLICKSCELTHAIRIGVNKIMVGEDEEGNPILKLRI